MAKKKKYSSEDFFKLLKTDDGSAANMGEFFSGLGLSMPLTFVSSDSLRVRRSVAWMKDSIDRFSNAELVTYFSSDLTSKHSIAPIVQALTSPSLFSKEQIIVVHNANKLKTIVLEELNNAVSKSQIFSLLLFFTEELSANLEKIGTSVEFEEFSKAKLGKWIKKEFTELGFDKVSNDTLNFLANSFNGNLGELSADISRICLLAVDGETIGPELAKSIVLSNAEASGFDLFASISFGKVTEAQEKLDLMYKQGMHPLQINAFLSRCFRTLAAKHGSSKELSNPWFSSKVKNFSKNYSPRYLSHSISKLAELDFALKDSGLPHEDQMANAVLRFSLRS